MLRRAGLTGLLACVMLAFAAPAWAQATAPEQVENLDARAGDNKVSLHIKAPKRDGGSPITHYEYRGKLASATSEGAWTRVPAYTGTVGGGIESHIAFLSRLPDGTALANDTAYSFQVRAVNSVGAGPASDFESATPQLNVAATYTVDRETGTINRRPLTPAPRVPARVSFTLRGGSTTISDSDGTGAADDGDGRFIYSLEWIRVTGSSETVIRTDKNRFRTTSYTIAPADVGSQLKVRVRWRDNRYNAEEFVSALFPSSGTILAAATCAAPTLTGGAERIWHREIDLIDIDHDEAVPNRYGAGDGIGTFTSGSNTYSIEIIYRATSGTEAGKLIFGLADSGSPLSATDTRQLTLYVCDEAYPLRNATLRTSSNNYEWSSPSTADWWSHISRDIYLTRDVEAPTVERTGISGAELTITFNEDLDSGSVPALDAFTVQVNGQPVELETGSTAVISGDTVTLTLAAAPPSNSRLTVEYTQPGTNNLRDPAWNEVADFTETVTRPRPPDLPDEPPGSPRNLTAAPGDGQVRLDWVAPASDGGAAITGYEYRYAEGTSVPEATAWIPVGEELTVTVMELTNDTEYTFEVRAVNAEGSGTPASVSATPGTEDESQPTPDPTLPETPAAMPPSAPERLRAAPDDNRVTLTWRAPASDGGAAILRYEYGIDGGAWMDAGTALTATVTDLVNGRSYRFEVRAVNAAGPGQAATVTVTVGNYTQATTAWLARFGRTVATHVTDAVGERMRDPDGLASHVTVGGYRLPLGRHTPGGTSSEAGAQPTGLAALMTELAGVLGLGGGSGGAPVGGGLGLTAGPDWDPWLDGPGSDPRLGTTRTLSLPGLRQMLMGSSFRLALGATDDGTAGTPLVTAWGRVSGTQFSGRERTLDVDGDVLQGTLGVDGTWDQWLAGLAVAHSRGDGSFESQAAGRRGDQEQSLTSIHPYLRYAVNDRLAVWGVLGYGWGEVTLKQEGAASLDTDTNFLMGAVGGRGVLLTPEDTGGFELATRTDVMLMRMNGDEVAGLAKTEADAHRLRVLLEGSRPVVWSDGRRLKPTVQVGLRHDWGDAEMGFGLEVGGRVRYADPRHGLTVEAAVRGLVAHEDSEYTEWGAWGTVRVDPGALNQGLAMTLAPTWGAARSGVEGLWGRETMAGLVPQTTGQAQAGRLNAEVSYGLAAGTWLLTPYVGTSLARQADRLYRVGGRGRFAQGTDTGLVLTLEGIRLEPRGPQPINQGVRLQVGWGF